ncbi:hypothetical protein PO909_014621 [Leuciscus waleckii]
MGLHSQYETSHQWCLMSFLNRPSHSSAQLSGQSWWLMTEDDPQARGLWSLPISLLPEKPWTAVQMEPFCLQCPLVQSFLSQQNSLMMKMVYQKNCCKNQHSITRNGSISHALHSQAPLSLSTHLAGRLWMRWRNSRGNKWNATYRRQKRNWRLKWRLPNMSINS